jgi:hypothetical protein
VIVSYDGKQSASAKRCIGSFGEDASAPVAGDAPAPVKKDASAPRKRDV